MKKIFKNLLLSSVVFLAMGSCVELEEEPLGRLSAKGFFQTEASFEAAIVGGFQPLYSRFNMWDFWIPLGAGAGAEDVHRIDGDFGSYSDFTPSTSNRVNNSLWSGLYRSITNVNVLIANLDNADFPQQKVGEYEGQARFLRAFSYFFLVRYFGEVPLVTFENQPQSATVGQSPVADIYDLIVKDLEIAESKLPTSFPEKPRPTRGAAKALLAKVYLTMAGWPIEDASYYAKARDKADELITGSLSGTYSLEEDYLNLWLEANKFNNSESIFGFYGISTAGWEPGSHNQIASRPGAEGGWADFYSEERFYNAFPDSYRKDVSFWTDFTNGTTWQDAAPLQPFIAKYRDAGSCGINDPASACPNDGDGFSIILRYAEVLLIYAEAANMAENGPSARAYDAINQVRRRANNLPVNTSNASVDLPTGLSVAAFDDEVIAERAWELAFENKRWFDLVRKKMVVEVNKDVYPNVSVNNRLIPKPALQVELTEGLEQNPGF